MKTSLAICPWPSLSSLGLKHTELVRVLLALFHVDLSTGTRPAGRNLSLEVEVVTSGMADSSLDGRTAVTRFSRNLRAWGGKVFLKLEDYSLLYGRDSLYHAFVRFAICL